MATEARHAVGALPGQVMLVAGGSTRIQRAWMRISAPPAPKLVLSVASSNLVVSWPASESGFVIQTAGALGATFQQGQLPFTPVPGQTNLFTSPQPATNVFIRLVKP